MGLSEGVEVGFYVYTSTLRRILCSKTLYYCPLTAIFGCIAIVSIASISLSLLARCLFPLAVVWPNTVHGIITLPTHIGFLPHLASLPTRRNLFYPVLLKHLTLFFTLVDCLLLLLLLLWILLLFWLKVIFCVRLLLWFLDGVWFLRGRFGSGAETVILNLAAGLGIWTFYKAKVKFFLRFYSTSIIIIINIAVQWRIFIISISDLEQFIIFKVLLLNLNLNSFCWS